MESTKTALKNNAYFIAHTKQTTSVWERQLKVVEVENSCGIKINENKICFKKQNININNM